MKSISASQYAKGKACAQIANKLVSSGRTKRGIKLHNVLSKYSKNKELFNILDRPDSQTNVSFNINIENILAKGIVDLLTNNSVYEWKSGEPEDWHHDQVRFYKWLTGRSIGYIVYLDYGEIVHVKGNIKDNDIIQAYNSMQTGTPTRNVLCSGCPIRKDCNEWQGEVTDDISKLIDVTLQIKRLNQELQSKYNRYIVDIEDDIKQLTLIENKLRETITNYDINDYRTAQGIIQVINTTKTTIDVSKYPINEYPAYYNVPKPNISKMKADFGKVETTKVVFVKPSI